MRTWGTGAVFATGVPPAGASDRAMRSLLHVLAAILATPLFIRLGGPSLFGLPDTASASSGGINVPVGAGLAIVVASWIWIQRRQRRTPSQLSVLDYSVLIFAAVASAVLLIGFLTRPGPYNVLYFGQTVLPLLAYYAISRVVRTGADALRVVQFALAGAAISGGLMLMQVLVSRGPARMLSSQLENHVGPLNIYQSNDYVPFVFAIVLLVALHERVATDRLGAIAMLVLWGLEVVVLASYARGPVFLLILGIAVLAIQMWRGHRQHTVRALAITGAAFGLAVLLGFPSAQRVAAMVGPIASVGPIANSPPVATNGPGAEPSAVPSAGPGEPTPSIAPPTVIDFDDSPAVVDQASNDTRTIAIRISTEYVMRHPAYGGGFAPIPWQDLSPILTGYPPNKLFTAHNQYLDFGLRGGVPLIAAYLGAMIVAALSAIRVVRSSPTIFAGVVAGAVMTALAATLFVGNLYQNNFTQPFSAFLLWALIGLIGALGARRS